jgi:hypothetical protein
MDHGHRAGKAPCGTPSLVPTSLIHLAPGEIAERDRLIAVVERHIEQFVDVGQALCRIRDERLYCGTHGGIAAPGS